MAELELSKTRSRWVSGCCPGQQEQQQRRRRLIPPPSRLAATNGRLAALLHSQHIVSKIHSTLSETPSPPKERLATGCITISAPVLKHLQVRHAMGNNILREECRQTALGSAAPQEVVLA